jgi:hypothetical protein
MHHAFPLSIRLVHGLVQEEHGCERAAYDACRHTDHHQEHLHWAISFAQFDYNVK